MAILAPYTPTCYRALNRHSRGWCWVMWTHSHTTLAGVPTRLAVIQDVETGESNTVRPKCLFADWDDLPDGAKDQLKTKPPVVRGACPKHLRNDIRWGTTTRT